MRRARTITKALIFATLTLTFAQTYAAEGIVVEANVKSVDTKNINVVSQKHEIALAKSKLPKDLVKLLQTKVGETNRTRFMIPFRSIASMKDREPQPFDPNDVNNKNR